MNDAHSLFLRVLRGSLLPEASWTEPLSEAQLGQVFQLARSHKVLPMIYEALRGLPAPSQILSQARQETIHAVMLQARKTGDFLTLYAFLRQKGLTPMVVKGIVCRDLYPRPDHRVSADEDLLIPAEQFAACQAAMEEFGMVPGDAGADAYEIPFRMPGSPLYIELHRSLFPPESRAYGDWNRLFQDVSPMALSVEGRELLTLPPAEHLLYLILHAFKHFLHSGFGIRQVCDICLFANRFGGEICWERLWEQLSQLRALPFTAALFRIGEEYLAFDPEEACYPESWQQIPVDPEPLLQELLEAGIYGGSSLSRRHSSDMTLDAVASQKEGTRAKGLAASLFPSAASLEGRYPYLREKPWLLPVAWADRIGKYAQETQSTSGSNAAEALKIAQKRIALLKAYGILDE